MDRKGVETSRVQISCSQFGKAFWQFANELLHFSKNCELLKSDTHEFLELFIELAIYEVILSLINTPC